MSDHPNRPHCVRIGRDDALNYAYRVRSRDLATRHASQVLHARALPQINWPTLPVTQFLDWSRSAGPLDLPMFSRYDVELVLSGKYIASVSAPGYEKPYILIPLPLAGIGRPSLMATFLDVCCWVRSPSWPTERNKYPLSLDCKQEYVEKLIKHFRMLQAMNANPDFDYMVDVWMMCQACLREIGKAYAANTVHA